MSIDRSIDPSVDLGPDMQAAAEAHLAAVWQAHYAEEDDPDAVVESPAVGPFCGCETCIVREVLAGAWPVIERHFAAVPDAGKDVRTDQAAGTS